MHGSYNFFILSFIYYEVSNLGKLLIRYHTLFPRYLAKYNKIIDCQKMLFIKDSHEILSSCNNGNVVNKKLHGIYLKYEAHFKRVLKNSYFKKKIFKITCLK